MFNSRSGLAHCVSHSVVTPVRTCATRASCFVVAVTDRQPSYLPGARLRPGCGVWMLVAAKAGLAAKSCWAANRAPVSPAVKKARQRRESKGRMGTSCIAEANVYHDVRQHNQLAQRVVAACKVCDFKADILPTICPRFVHDLLTTCPYVRPTSCLSQGTVGPVSLRI